MIKQWHFAATAITHETYLSEFGFVFLSPSEASLFNSWTSLLNIRRDLPNDLAESGNRFAPKRTKKTSAKTTKCHGLSAFIPKYYPKLLSLPGMRLIKMQPTRPSLGLTRVAKSPLCQGNY